MPLPSELATTKYEFAVSTSRTPIFLDHPKSLNHSPYVRKTARRRTPRSTNNETPKPAGADQQESQQEPTLKTMDSPNQPEVADAEACSGKTKRAEDLSFK